MRKHITILLTLLLTMLPFAGQAFAHPGKVDANGGHYCRTNCAKYGLKDGQYHYHNADGSATLTKPSTSKPTSPKPKPPVAPAPLSVYINGAKQIYDQPPVIDNGRTLVPLRGIFESLGATVAWDAKTQTVTANRGNTKMLLKIGSKSPTVNGKVTSIDVPAKIVNGRTLVPLRFVGETLGADVKYDSANRTINITATVN